MNNKSNFLFDDREFLFFGKVTAECFEYAEELVAEVRKSKTKMVFHASKAIVSVATALTISTPQGVTPAHIYLKVPVERNRQQAGFADRNEFISNRNFLGLKQGQMAQLLGLSESTVEKFEQGVYFSSSAETLKAVAVFNEWVSVLKEYHGDRKYVVRPILKARMNALGDVSPFEYAFANSIEGIRDLIGLERKMYG